jgi:uncharacterized protein (TIGR02996 family)
MRSNPANRPEVLAFLEDARENPDDDTPRLVLADWLMDHDEEARGEFVRLQVESARQGPGDLPGALGKRRAEQLLRQHQTDWLGPIRLGWGGSVEFQRGLLQLTLTVRTVRRNGKEADRWPEAWAWVERVFVREVSNVHFLASSPVLRHLTWLDLDNVGIGPGEAQVLASSPFLGRLLHLSLASSLQVGGPRIGDDGLAALAGSPHLARLRSLWLNSNEITGLGLAILGQSPHLAQLASLELGGNDIGLAGVQALAWSPHLTRLTHLGLSLTGLGDQGTAALAASSHLAGLTYLNLQSNHIGPRGAQALAASPHLARLTHLYLAMNRLGDAGVQALANAPQLARLTSLDLLSNQITEEGVWALIRSPYLTRLTHLGLQEGRPFSPEVRQALRQRFGLAVR